MYTRKDESFTTNLCVHVCIVAESMCIFMIDDFVNKNLCLWLCCCRGYVHMKDWAFWKRVFVFMFVLFYRVCAHVILIIWVTIFLFIFVLLQRVCIYVRLGIMTTRLSIYICVLFRV